MTVGLCKHCGASIIHFALESGRTVPFNPEPCEDGNGFLGEDNVMRVVTPEPKEYRGQMVSMPLFKAHRCRF